MGQGESKGKQRAFSAFRVVCRESGQPMARLRFEQKDVKNITGTEISILNEKESCNCLRRLSV